MSYSDNKHDDNMEAGLLSNHGEERNMSKEAQFQDEEPVCPRTNKCRNSPARRIFMGLGICFLLGLALVSIGSATGVCPGHLRHAMNGHVSIKDAVHSHKPNLSDPNGHLVRRQTPAPGSSTDSGSKQTSEASKASAASTEAAATTDAKASATQTQASQASSSNKASSQQQDTTKDAASSTKEESPSSTKKAAETTASNKEATTTQDAKNSQTTDDSKTTDSGETTVQKQTEASTITTGTRTTSSAVEKTYTSTLPNGGVTTMTSTSWVAVVPSAAATESSNPNLQNAAPQHSVHGVLGAAIGMMFGGLLIL